MLNVLVVFVVFLYFACFIYLFSLIEWQFGLVVMVSVAITKLRYVTRLCGIYTVSQKTTHLTFDHNFGKCRPIFFSDRFP